MAIDEEGTSSPSVRDVLRTYADALILAEPLQLTLWSASGVTLMQLRVLRILCDGPHPAGRLASLAGVQPASLSRVLDRLEAEGLVARQADAADRRRVAVEISAAGRRLLGHRPWKGSPFEAAVLAMGPEERRAFIDAVDSFVGRVRSLAAAAGED